LFLLPIASDFNRILPGAEFSRYAGGVIGQTLAMEGMFAFFLESAFVGALIWGEKRLGPRNHFLAAWGG
jgi:cytochrome bd ubiquinol oxidase subunit I